MRFICVLFLSGHTEHKPLTSIIGDISLAADVTDALRGVDSVIHTAGIVSLGTFPDMEAMEAVNVTGGPEQYKNFRRCCTEYTKPQITSM